MKVLAALTAGIKEAVFRPSGERRRLLGNQLKAYPNECWIPFSKGGARGWCDEQSHG